MPWKKGQSGNPLGRLPGEKQFACSQSLLRNGIMHSSKLRIAKQCRGKKDNPATR
jgi:hypothetical protein